MDDSKILDLPKDCTSLQAKAEAMGFSMCSDAYNGTLLKSLIASKPGGHFLELGTGLGLSLAWINILIGSNTVIYPLYSLYPLIDAIPYPCYS